MSCVLGIFIGFFRVPVVSFLENDVVFIADKIA